MLTDQTLWPHDQRPGVEAILDTNVVLDWLVFEDPSVRPLAAALQSHALCWLATPPMLGELARVLGRRGLERWQPRLAPALAFARGTCRIVEPLPVPSASKLRCSDPDDQMFIDLALARRVPWLFSRDKALLQLARRARRLGVRVLQPAALAIPPGQGPADAAPG